MRYENINYIKDKCRRIINYYTWDYKHCATKCTACNGIGIYDNDNSPPCMGCDGSGFDTVQYMSLIEQLLVQELSSYYFKELYNDVFKISKLIQEYNLQMIYGYAYMHPKGTEYDQEIKDLYDRKYDALMIKINEYIEPKGIVADVNL